MPNGDWVGGPYARLYATLQDDHPAVWADNDRLAWYVRLLVPAERAWPVRLGWPRGLPEAVQAALVADGAVEAHDHDRYQIHGLDRLRMTQGTGQNWGAHKGGQARAAQAIRGPDGTFLPADAQPPGPAAIQPPGALNGGTPEHLDPGPGSEVVQVQPQVQAESSHQPIHPVTSHPVPPRAAPSGPGAGTRTRAPAPAPEAPDPRTVTGHPRYQDMAAEERDWEAWAESQAEPSTYPDARPSNQGRYGTANPVCRSPETIEHRRYWRWIGTGRGWVCLYCDRSDTRTFQERMDDATKQSPF